MRTFRGLMKAYWFSERWKEAWALTAVIAVLTALSSKAGVWFAVASGNLVNSIAYFHESASPNPLRDVLVNAGWLVLLVVLKDAGFTGVRHLFSTTLHRKWRGWLNSRFNAALLDGNHTHFHVQHNGGGEDDAPDNIDQRVHESIKGMTGGAIGLAMGIMGVTTSIFFVGQKLLQSATPVEGLTFLGIYGSAILALLAVCVYVPLNTWIAVKLGGLLERLTIRLQQAEGGYRGELTMFLRRSFNIAASRGEDVQKLMHERRYEDIDRTWARMNVVNAGYMSFVDIYNFIGSRIVAYGPGIIPFINDRIDLKGYITGAELVASLISQCSWFIQVMPAIATLKANSRRVIELAEMIEKVQQPQAFYAASGRSSFVYETQNPSFGLTVRNVELAHGGPDEPPFLMVPRLHFRPGEWVFVKGESGCGKTSLVKALNGLWPYGSGTVVMPEGVETFYAAQEIKLPQVTLKELVCLPGLPDAHGDEAVEAALAAAGLEAFRTSLAEEGREGKIWDQVLSGGQKQKLVVARILLQQPGILFLDEATAALDPEGRTAFHQAIKDHCAGTTVISIMHEAVPPKSATGAEFYDSVVAIAHGVATKRSLVPPLPREITAALDDARPVDFGRLVFPRKRPRTRRIEAAIEDDQRVPLALWQSTTGLLSARSNPLPE
ncbi:MAG: ABC transporter ATP-binding protein/permease [Pararhizobium sp.]